MKRYVEKVFKRFKLVARQSVLTLLQEGIEAALSDAPLADDRFTEDFEYREKVGSALYYMLCMRPDIPFAIGLLARYSNKVSRVAAAGVTHLLYFIYNTRGTELTLEGHSAYIKAFCDADWADYRDSRRSTNCHIVYLGSGPIKCASKLQRLQVFRGGRIPSYKCCSADDSVAAVANLPDRYPGADNEVQLIGLHG